MDKRNCIQSSPERLSWAYTATQGAENTRKFLAEKLNERGGVKITPDDILFLMVLVMQLQKFLVL